MGKLFLCLALGLALMLVLGTSDGGGSAGLEGGEKPPAAAEHEGPAEPAEGENLQDSVGIGITMTGETDGEHEEGRSSPEGTPPLDD